MSEPVTKTYQVHRSTRASKIAMSLGLVAVVLLAAAPWWAGRGDMRMLVEIFTYVGLAQMWSLLAGYGGLVSIGQQAFVGLGGYMLFALATFAGVPPLAALLLAGLIAALIAIPTALVAFRLQGAYFAIGTWVIAEVFRLGFAQASALGGGSGMSLPAGIVRDIAASAPAREALIYWLARRDKTDKVFAVLLLIIAIGILQDRLFVYLDKRLFPHKYYKTRAEGLKEVQTGICIALGIFALAVLLPLFVSIPGDLLLQGAGLVVLAAVGLILMGELKLRKNLQLV